MKASEQPSAGGAPVQPGPRGWWSRLDKTAATLLTLAAFAGMVAVGARAFDRVVSAEQLDGALQKQAAVDAEQDEDLELLFQTQVRLVTSVENLQQEVREVRKDLRALDAGRPLPALTPSAPAPPRSGEAP